MKRVAIQGIAGSYHDVASRSYFEGEDIEIVPCSSFKEVFACLHKDPTLIALVAIENTIAGSLLPNYELLRESHLTVVGEYKLHITHSFAALKGTKIEDIVEIGSHPIALMQCADFLNQFPNVRVVEKNDTAYSAREIAEKKLVGHAAICGATAAETYGLEILERGIETNKRNFTRFLVLADRWNAEPLLDRKKCNKASLVFAVPHTSGSLCKVLSTLWFYNINLSKIQSLPIIGREWEYLFYVDLTFDNYMEYRQALDAIRPLTKECNILGEYEEGRQSV
ncbi:MAG: prephenate dehydratase [Bacteroidales bacterium]|nr:prephenate dehydratase [Bacteroidales bacterium]